MSDWFTVTSIDSQTFVISEYKHWEETHCYLLCGRERAILIDTGLGVSNIKAVVDSLSSLPLMVVTTHVHWDHIGGHGYFDCTCGGEGLAVRSLSYAAVDGQEQSYKVSV